MKEDNNLESVLMPEILIDKEVIDEAKSRILTGEQYTQTQFAQEGNKRSYCFKLEREDKKIYFFGSEHIYNPQDVLFQEIKEEFMDFQPDMVYIEGRTKSGMEVLEREMPITSEEEACKRGEPAYVAKLVFDNRKDWSIEIESPEPDSNDEAKRLEEKGFTRKEICQYYFMRLVAQFHRHQKKSGKGGGHGHLFGLYKAS